MLAQRGHRSARIKARQAVKVGGPPRADGAVVRAREDAPRLGEHSEGTQRARRGHSDGPRDDALGESLRHSACK